MERRYETTSLSLQEEKKILADIKALKGTVGSAEKLIEIKPLMDNLYSEKKAIVEKLNGF